MNGEIVKAVPGSGKTFTLIERCYDLMVKEGVENIVAITFTERAASQLMDRLKEKARANRNDDLLKQLPDSNVGTIHNFCSTIIRDYGELEGLPRNFAVMDDLESYYFMVRIVREYILSSQDNKKDRESGRYISKIQELFGGDVEDIIRWITEILDSHKGYFIRMKLSFGSFRTSYDRKYFTGEVMNEIQSKLNISIIPYILPLIEKVVDYYQQVKVKRGLQDFDDLLVYSSRISKKAGKELAERYKFILIDEFQDTDETQLDIFRTLLENGSQVFAVGDPYQSIYTFRGAHLDAQERLSRYLENRLTLDTNRRSKPELIRFYNSLFPKILGADKMKEFAQGEGKVTFYIEEDENSAISEIIKKSVRNGMKFGDIAILSRTSTGFLKLRSYLRKEGIESVTVSGESILKSQEGLDIYNLVRYLGDPGDKVAQAGILFSPMFGFDVTQSFNLKSEIDRIINERLSKYRELLRKEGVNFVIQEILTKEGYFSNLRRDPLLNEKNDRIWRIMVLLSSYARRNGNDIYGLIRWLENGQNDRENGPIDDILEDDRRVKIMTIHQAKGLEFKKVIVCGLGSGRDTEKYIVDDVTGLLVKKNSGFFSSPTKKLVEGTSRSVHLSNEERRIMYVAFTRAKDELDIVLEKKDLSSESKCEKKDDLICLLQKNIGFGAEQSETSLIEAFTQFHSNFEKISPTDPLPMTVSDNPGTIYREAKAITEDEDVDELNAKAIKEFVDSRGEIIKIFRVAIKGSLMTVTNGGISIFERERVKGSYFVKNGKIEFVI